MGIEWKEAYNLGQADIDQQHRHLFDLTNALMDADNVVTMRSLIMQLYKHTREHFEQEENLMRKMKFPDLEVHTHYHNKLLSRLNTISQEVGQGVFNKPALTQLMNDWALHHIPLDDAAIATFMNTPK
ncbi:bacteriohemerythrin [Rhodoferax lithotrophicus]|uniref:Bacteriohemerythrin n=1 Tax=Rhodoferax lithotrophicus TaxID=2798804 RepID=A0ABN6CZR4_9BURK|nr:bacteriohemerythrin [Rhodoferax sp. MIZ03]BCO25232.1 bacteriohemerythrin [Rhodoferax sp. MIZ03]